MKIRSFFDKDNLYWF